MTKGNNFAMHLSRLSNYRGRISTFRSCTQFFLLHIALKSFRLELLLIKYHGMVLISTMCVFKMISLIWFRPFAYLDAISRWNECLKLDSWLALYFPFLYHVTTPSTLQRAGQTQRRKSLSKTKKKNSKKNFYFLAG